MCFTQAYGSKLVKQNIMMVKNGIMHQFKSEHSVCVKNEPSLDILSFAELVEVANQGKVWREAEHARYPEEAYSLRDWYQKEVFHLVFHLEPASVVSLSSSCVPSAWPQLHFELHDVLIQQISSPQSPATSRFALTICGTDSLCELNSNASSNKTSSASHLMSQA